MRFLRFLAYPPSPVDVDRATVFASLRRFCASGQHEFWAGGVSLRDKTLVDTTVIISPRQSTDIYLLGLATRMGGSWRRSMPASR